LAAIGGRGSQALASMVFASPPTGDGAAVVEDARTAGVAWLITASGLHLAVMVLLAERLAGLAHLGKRGRAIVSLAMAVVVCIAAGLRVSLLRAALAGGAGLVARLLGRRREATTGLAAAVLLLVALDSSAAYDVGLQLAVCAVLAIALFGPLAKEWIAPLVGRRAAWALGASVAAQAGIAPLAASLFGGLAVLGPVVLVIGGPVVEVAVALGLAGAVAGVAGAGAGDVLLRVASQAAAAATAVWHVAAQVPGAVVPVPAQPAWALAAWSAGAVGLWMWWPRPRRAARVRIGAVALGLVVALSGFVHGVSGAVIDVMDVGQGDAIVIRDGAHAVLVDTGAEPAVLRQALARAGVGALEGVVLTHAHADHVGGLDGLAGIARPGWIGVPDVVDTAVDALATDCGARAAEVVRLRRDMTFTVGRVTVRVLWPRGGDRRLAANDTSVVLLATCEGRTALLLGDAEEQAQRGVLDVFAGPVDMLKVAHHGSRNGNVPLALETWRPPLALISVGAGNSFGHPSSAALDELAAIGARVRRTDRESDLLWDWSVPALRAASLPVASVLLCDNRTQTWPPFGRTDAVRQAAAWLPPISPTSSPSTSSTAPSRCCSSAPRSGCVTAWPPSPTWISTWMSSTGPRPPPTMCSTPPTRCRS
jgi:competence protein ComEC